MTILDELLVAALLAGAAGAIATAEAAVLALDDARVRELGAAGASGRALALVRSTPARAGGIRAVVTLLGAGAAAFGGAAALGGASSAAAAIGAAPRLAGAFALAAVVLVAAVGWHALVLEIPRAVSARAPEQVALASARPLSMVSLVGWPIHVVAHALAELLLRPFGVPQAIRTVSSAEVLGTLDRAGTQGGVSRPAAAMAARAITLDRLPVGSVMFPRGEVGSIDVAADPAALARVLDATERERLVVRRGPEELIGYVTTRDLGRLLLGREAATLAEIARPLEAVPYGALALDVLAQLQRSGVPMAVVVGEAGGVDGVVDIDDLAAEVMGTLLVGAVRDEGEIVHEGPGAITVAATMRVHVANRVFGLDLPTSVRWSTLGGLVLGTLETFPDVGVVVRDSPRVELEVIEASAGRIRRLRIRARP